MSCNRTMKTLLHKKRVKTHNFGGSILLTAAALVTTNYIITIHS